VPTGVLAVLAARLFITETRDTSRGQRLDLPGLIASGIGLFALTYGLIETNRHGWTSSLVLSMFVIAAVSLAAFVLLEWRQRVPMLDLSLFRDVTFAGANAVMLLIGVAMFGVFFFNSLFIQNVLGFSAVQSGATFLPMTLMFVFVAPIAGRFADQVGSRWLMGLGLMLVALSLLLFGRLDATSTFWSILPGLLTSGLGMALSMAPTTAAVMGSVPVDKAGVGSSVVNSMRQVGGAIGIAVMGALFASKLHVGPADLRFAGQFVAGYHLAVHVAAAVALAGAVIALITVRRLHHPDPGETPEPVATTAVNR
jgi:EmrB/QacA subfamily drug resistance transporter